MTSVSRFFLLAALVFSSSVVALKLPNNKLQTQFQRALANEGGRDYRDRYDKEAE